MPMSFVRPLRTLLGAGVVLLIVMGCAPAPAPTSIPPTPTAITNPLVGSYTYTYGVGNSGDKARLTLLADGTWSLVIYEGIQAGTLDAGGTYKVTGDQIAITTKRFHGFPCSPDQELSTYKWAFDGQVLIFNTVDDPCGERAVQFTAGLWEKE